MDQTAYFNQMREKRKKEILSAARKMLLKDGPASFTMQNLAKNLDISTVTLYKYFKNMEDERYWKKYQVLPWSMSHDPERIGREIAIISKHSRYV